MRLANDQPPTRSEHTLHLDEHRYGFLQVVKRGGDRHHAEGTILARKLPGVHLDERDAFLTEDALRIVRRRVAIYTNDLREAAEMLCQEPGGVAVACCDIENPTRANPP